MNPFDHEAVITELKAAIKANGRYSPDPWYVGEESEDGTFVCVDVEDHGDRRWSRGETVIIRHVPSGNHYAFGQDIGLTEYQESEVYADDVWLVEPVVKVVETTTWKRVA